MTHRITVESRDGLRRVVLSEGDDGTVARYYRFTGRCWDPDRTCVIKKPMHAALDLVDRIINRAPPRVEMR